MCTNCRVRRKFCILLLARKVQLLLGVQAIHEQRAFAGAVVVARTAGRCLRSARAVIAGSAIAVTQGGAFR